MEEFRITPSWVLFWIWSNGETCLHDREIQEVEIYREDKLRFRLVDCEASEGHLGDDIH